MGAMKILYQEQPFDLSNKPLLRQCHEIWSGWKSNPDRLPMFQGLDLSVLPGHALRNATLVDVIDGGKDIYYRFWGTGLTELLHVDYTGKRLSEWPNRQMTVPLMEQYTRVIESESEFLSATVYTAPNGRKVDRHNLRLPLAGKTSGVAHILNVNETLYEAVELMRENSFELRDVMD
jgi:hypothetical protein